MSTTPRVFISYCHDSDEHRNRVLALSERLRNDGFETILDQYVNGSPHQGWPRWMLDQLDTADFVLVVCSKAYYRRFRGHEEPGKGKGGDWEGALITQEIYNARSKTLKFVPVFLSAAFENWIPEPLRVHTHYALTSKRAYEHLCDFLLGVAGFEPSAIGSVRKRQRQKGTSLNFAGEGEATTLEHPADISRIIQYAPAELIGREHELNLLSAAWEGDVQGLAAYPVISIKHRPKILTFVALGGEGKTSLVAKWAAELAAQDWPGCVAAFAWSFYSQGSQEQMATSSDLFLKEALTYFGDDADKQFAASAAGAYEKGQRLARIVGARRSLLILDGLEPLQYGPTSPTSGELKDQGVIALLKNLAATSRGLCVVTTRYSLPDLRAFWQNTAPEVTLQRLSRAAGVHLLQSLGVKGSPHRNIRFDDGKEQLNQFEQLVEDVKGHALTLNLFGTYLRDAHAGDIRKRDLVKLEEANAEEQGGHAFRVMEAYEREFELAGDQGKRALAVLRLLGLFDRSITSDCLNTLLQHPAIPELTEPLVDLTKEQRNLVFQRLDDAKLLTVNRDVFGALVSVDAHPLLREYFAGRMYLQRADAWREAHRRLYHHLCAVTEGDQPSLDTLQPLYQAVTHGARAGLSDAAYENVLKKRIFRGHPIIGYSWRKLGASNSDLSALAALFQRPWDAKSLDIVDPDPRADILLITGEFLCLRRQLDDGMGPTNRGVR